MLSVELAKLRRYVLRRQAIARTGRARQGIPSQQMERPPYLSDGQQSCGLPPRRAAIGDQSMPDTSKEFCPSAMHKLARPTGCTHEPASHAKIPRDMLAPDSRVGLRRRNGQRRPGAQPGSSGGRQGAWRRGSHSHDELLLCHFRHIDGDGGVFAAPRAAADVERRPGPLARPRAPVHPPGLVFPSASVDRRYRCTAGIFTAPQACSHMIIEKKLGSTLQFATRVRGLNLTASSDPH